MLFTGDIDEFVIISAQLPAFGIFHFSLTNAALFIARTEEFGEKYQTFLKQDAQNFFDTKDTPSRRITYYQNSLIKAVETNAILVSRISRTIEGNLNPSRTFVKDTDLYSWLEENNFLFYQNADQYRNFQNAVYDVFRDNMVKALMDANEHKFPVSLKFDWDWQQRATHTARMGNSTTKTGSDHGDLRQQETLQVIIGALLEILTGRVGVEKFRKETQQTLIRKIQDAAKNVKGLSSDNIERHFALAKNIYKSKSASKKS